MENECVTIKKKSILQITNKTVPNKCCKQPFQQNFSGSFITKTLSSTETSSLLYCKQII